MRKGTEDRKKGKKRSLSQPSLHKIAVDDARVMYKKTHPLPSILYWICCAVVVFGSTSSPPNGPAERPEKKTSTRIRHRHRHTEKGETRNIWLSIQWFWLVYSDSQLISTRCCCQYRIHPRLVVPFIHSFRVFFLFCEMGKLQNTFRWCVCLHTLHCIQNELFESNSLVNFDFHVSRLPAISHDVLRIILLTIETNAGNAQICQRNIDKSCDEQPKEYKTNQFYPCIRQYNKCRIESQRQQPCRSTLCVAACRIAATVDQQGSARARSRNGIVAQSTQCFDDNKMRIKVEDATRQRQRQRRCWYRIR